MVNRELVNAFNDLSNTAPHILTHGNSFHVLKTPHLAPHPHNTA